jgi:chloride channel 3/4/5
MFSQLMPGTYPAAANFEHSHPYHEEESCPAIHNNLSPKLRECGRTQIEGTESLFTKAANRMYPGYGQSPAALPGSQHYEHEPNSSPQEVDENTSLLSADDRRSDNGSTWSNETGLTVIHERLAAAYDYMQWKNSNEADLPPSPPLSCDEFLHRDMTVQSAKELQRGGFENDITSTDRLHDVVAASGRRSRLFHQVDVRSRLQLWSDPLADFVLVLVVGVVTAIIASGINVAEAFLFDLKRGYCGSGWYLTQARCCAGQSKDSCQVWKPWSEHFGLGPNMRPILDSALFGTFCVAFALLGCYITLWSKINSPTRKTLPTKAEPTTPRWERDSYQSMLDHEARIFTGDQPAPTKPLYSAAGSGVAEIKVIMSGFLVPGFLGIKSLTMRTLALIPTVASGLSIGKEGPLIHIAASVGEVVSTAFSHIKSNIDDTRRKEITSMCAACGMSLAFGTPLVGVFFTLEEFDHQFSSKALIRAFLCSGVATTTLKFLDPYGTGKALLFQVTYNSTWIYAELPVFILLGVLGGVIGAMLVKLNAHWMRLFQQINLVQSWPQAEVGVVAVISGIVTFWNEHLGLSSVQLIFELISPSVMSTQAADGQSPNVIFHLAVAFLLKAFLTIITLGLKVPAGVYIPSMVLGGLMGRIVGHISQHHILSIPPSTITQGIPLPAQTLNPNALPGIYAIIGAGATLTGVTNLTATIVIALLEFSHSPEYLIPFGIAILSAKLTSRLISPASFYDHQIRAKGYPYMDSKRLPNSDRTVTDILQPLDEDNTIQLSTSSLVSSTELRRKLQLAGNPDGTLTILRNGQFRGLLSTTSLINVLSRLPPNVEKPCLLAVDSGWDVGDAHMLARLDVLDLTPLIDASPLFLDVGSPLEVVRECFVGLGVRCICVVREGRVVGCVNRRDFCTI